MMAGLRDWAKIWVWITGLKNTIYLASNYSQISTNDYLSTTVIFWQTIHTLFKPLYNGHCCDLLWPRSNCTAIQCGVELSKIIQIIATNGSSVTLTLAVLKGRVGNNFFISLSLTLFTKPFHCVLVPSIVHLKTSGITKHWLISRSLLAGLELWSVGERSCPF